MGGPERSPLAYRRSIVRRTFGNASEYHLCARSIVPQIASGSGIHPLEFSDPFVPAAKSFSISENGTSFLFGFRKMETDAHHGYGVGWPAGFGPMNQPIFFFVQQANDFCGEL